MRQPSKSRRRNTCVSAPNRTSRSESSYRADFQCEMRAVVGSQSAPIGTPPNCRSNNRVRGITETREGSRFGSDSHLMNFSAELAVLQRGNQRHESRYSNFVARAE